MIILRKLTYLEVERFALRKGVRKIAVENFLSSCYGQLPGQAIANCYIDTSLYAWDSNTKQAILDGIKLASG